MDEAARSNRDSALPPAGRNRLGFALDSANENTITGNHASGKPTNFNLSGARANELTGNVAEGGNIGFVDDNGPGANVYVGNLCVDPDESESRPAGLCEQPPPPGPEPAPATELGPEPVATSEPED